MCLCHILQRDDFFTFSEGKSALYMLQNSIYSILGTIVSNSGVLDVGFIPVTNLRPTITQPLRYKAHDEKLHLTWWGIQYFI